MNATNLNWTAISMFSIFVVATLWITKWAAQKSKSAADFYTAGGGITGFQNGLAIAGDLPLSTSNRDGGHLRWSKNGEIVEASKIQTNEK